MGIKNKLRVLAIVASDANPQTKAKSTFLSTHTLQHANSRPFIDGVVAPALSSDSVDESVAAFASKILASLASQPKVQRVLARVVAPFMSKFRAFTPVVLARPFIQSFLKAMAAAEAPVVPIL